MNKSLFVSVLALISASGYAFADNDFLVVTDRVAYTGTVSRFDNLSDAMSNSNATGVHAIPNRVTSAPYDTPNRDASFFFGRNFVEGGATYNHNIFLTAWPYTTDANHDRYSGWGNPNNTNTGFVQLYDEDGSTTTARDGAFGDFDGTFYTSFTLTASGENADAVNDFTRLWPAPTIGGAASISSGTMISWDMNVTFTGLEGVLTGSLIEATDHPDGVMGTFSAVFLNEGTDPLLNGYYRADFTFNMDSWAFGQGTNLVGGPINDSYFAVVVPSPAAFSVLAFGGVTALRRRRRA